MGSIKMITDTRNDEADRIRSLLTRPLMPALIDVIDNRDYLPISQAITQANRIFGHGGWTTEIREHLPVTNTEGYVTAYKCIVRVSVPALGASYDGVGLVEMTKRRGDPNPLQTAQAHDTAMKGAESDAVKRALRYLGDTFGNALYEKDDHRKRVFEYVCQAIRTKDMTRQEAENIVLGAFAKWQDMPISIALQTFYNHRDQKAAAARPSHNGSSHVATEEHDILDDDDINDEADEWYPGPQESRVPPPDDTDHEDIPPRRYRDRDPFRDED